jgi:predicted O-methyltransferase YrrM
MRYLLAGAVFSVFLVCGIWIANPSYLPLAACVIGIINILLLRVVYRRLIRELQASNAQASNNADDAIAQAQSLAWIEKQIDFRAPPTALTGWAAAPDFAALLVSTVLQHQPRLIVEAGSGASTVLVAYCMEKVGQDGRIVSLDHDKPFGDETNRRLADHKLESIARVVHAPLRDHSLNGQTWKWYDTSFISSLPGTIDLLVVDGPPRATQPLARYPALPLLIDQLSPNAIVLVDDAARDDEKEIVRRWTSQHPAFSSRYFNTRKGTTILYRGRSC